MTLLQVLRIFINSQITRVINIKPVLVVLFYFPSKRFWKLFVKDFSPLNES